MAKTVVIVEIIVWESAIDAIFLFNTFCLFLLHLFVLKLLILEEKEEWFDIIYCCKWWCGGNDGSAGMVTILPKHVICQNVGGHVSIETSCLWLVVAWGVVGQSEKTAFL